MVADGAGMPRSSTKKAQGSLPVNSHHVHRINKGQVQPSRPSYGGETRSIDRGEA